jgi:murein DD-endopeptidase MepM/ murein hydrolase activator NlpD
MTMLGLAISVGTAGILLPHQPAIAFTNPLPKQAYLIQNDSPQVTQAQLQIESPQTQKFQNDETKHSLTSWFSESTSANSIYTSFNRFWQERQEASLQQLEEKQQRLINTIATLKKEKTQSYLSSDLSPQTKLTLLADLRLEKTYDRANSFYSKNNSARSTENSQTQLGAILASNTEVNKNQAKTLPLSSSLHVSAPTLLTAAAVVIYEVKAGDTIEKIARRYQVSVPEILKLNKLGNPKLLQINTSLKIPVVKRVDRVSDRVAFSGTVESERDSLQLNKSQQQKYGAGDRSIVTSSESKNLENQADNFDRGDRANLYLTRLKEDIVQLQKEYREQPNKVSTNVATFPNAIAPQLLARSSSLQPSNLPVGGEFPANTPPQNPVLPNNRVISNDSRSPQNLLTSAPITPENYNRSLNFPEGADVLPELPPLSPPEQYLPGNPTRFNGYIWPAKGKLSSGFGLRWGKMHKGIDIAAPVGTPIYAAASGEVVSAGWSSGGYGHLVKLKHPDGSLTVYAHNSRILVRSGQSIEQGQQIAEMGSTGFSTGPHLHFEIHPIGRNAVNPISYLPKFQQVQ